MKWCRFQVEQRSRYGIVEDDTRITEVSGSPFDTYTVRSTTYTLNEVKLLAPDMQHGDVVEIEISGIGTLRNRVADA